MKTSLFMKIIKELMPIITFFDFKGEIKTITLYGNGHINKTFLIATTKDNYIFQVINSYAFKNIDVLVNNIYIVTDHLSKKNVPSLEMIPTLTKALYYSDSRNYYRMYKFVTGTKCYEEIENLEMVTLTAEAFGDLHYNLSDLDANLLKEVIPHFHDTPKRYRDLLDAKEKDVKGRFNTCINEFNDVELLKDKFDLITSALDKKEIPLKITHNDPKINNVLFDEKTNEVKCVIDLDTVMPGSVLYDFGDALRSLFTGSNEDNIDPSTCRVNFDIYRAYLSGYYSKMANALNDKEIELLPYAPFVLSIECGIRFLEDYLRGDVYFHTTYPEHNLVRARTQINQAKDILNNIDKLKEITKEITGR